jgi:hypothetical protein
LRELVELCNFVTIVMKFGRGPGWKKKMNETKFLILPEEFAKSEKKNPARS